MMRPARAAPRAAAALAAGLWLAPAALADPPLEVMSQGDASGGTEVVKPQEPDPGSGFKFLGIVQGKYSISNVVPTSAYLNGQVIGALGGSNLTEIAGTSEDTTADQRSRFGEYRTVGFFRYKPPLFDGRGELAAAFEVDFVPGDLSYTTGGNAGGAFGGDTVNLQTRRLNATFRPRLGGGHKLDIVTGLQFLADGVYNPATAHPDDLFRAGGGLRFWGSEAAGVSAYGRWGDSFSDRLRYRAGAFTLYEQGVGLDDDVTLYMADLQVLPFYGAQVGVHAWYMRDYGGGGGGAFGAGPSSALAELQGAARLDFRPDEDSQVPPVDTDVVWIMADAGYNHALTTGPVGATGFAVANVGKIYVEDQADPSVGGAAAGAEARWRYAPGAGSIARAEVLWTSANGPEDDSYDGVITGNSYGLVGAVYATHGAVLLLPDIQAVNRHVGVVYDISNRGAGLLALSSNVGYDLIPNKLTLTGGAAYAATPAGEPLGTEVNGRLVAHPWFLFDVGLTAGRVYGARQLTDNPYEVTPFVEDPWVVYTHIYWVVF